jgi:hypothetical protein
MITKNVSVVRPFKGKRVRFESSRSFDEVLQNLKKLVNILFFDEAHRQGML